MAGVTDIAFRQICREMGCGFTVTEMISAKALCFQDSKTKVLMELSEDEHPAGVQLFGSEPDCMAAAAEKVMELQGPDFIDSNMGCPVGKVVKSRRFPFYPPAAEQAWSSCRRTGVHRHFPS